MATRQPNNPAGFGIQAIEFGDRIIFSNAQNVPLAVFGTGSFVRGLVKGAAIAAGLDITITGGAGAGLSNAMRSLLRLRKLAFGADPSPRFGSGLVSAVLPG